MKHIQHMALVLLLVLALLWLWACDKGSDYRLGIELVEPLDDPPLSRASRLELLVVNTLDSKEQAFFEFGSQEDSFDGLSLRLDGIGYYPQFVAVATAYDADDEVIAIGRTADVVTRAYDGLMVGLYLAPPAAATRPPVELTRARAGLVIASPNEADVLVIGGTQAGPEGLRDTIAPVGYFSPIAYTLTSLTVEDRSVRFGDGVVGHRAATLNAGTVVVAGGYSQRGEKRQWLETPYLIASHLTEVVAPLSSGHSLAPRHRLAMAPALQLGEVWICGGETPDGKLLDDYARVSDEDTSLHQAQSLDTPRAGHSMTPVIDGDGEFVGVIIYGGNEPDTPPAAFWEREAKGPVSLVDAPAESRHDHAAHLIGPGRVLVAGGYVDGVLSANLRSISTECADSAPCPRVRDHGDLLHVPRAGHSLTAMSDTLSVVCGGVGEDGEALDSCEFLQREGNKLVHAGLLAMSTPRRDHAAVLLPDGTVMIAGGYNSTDGALATLEIITPPLP